MSVTMRLCVDGEMPMFMRRVQYIRHVSL